MRALAEAIQRMIIEPGHKLSIEQVVELAFGVDEHGKPNKSHWTLYREINPDDTGAKLAAIDLFKLMRATGRHAPLEVMALHLGYQLTPIGDSVPDKPTLPEELLDDIPSLAAYHDAIRQGLPLEAVHAVLLLAIKDLNQDFVAYRTEREAKAGKQPRRKAS
jgi:hypothetical protein